MNARPTDPRQRTIVVCGPTGYLGGHVVRALHADGWRVRALVRDASRLGAAAEYCDEVFVGHPTDATTLDGLFDGAGAAFSSIGVRSFKRRPHFRDVDERANLHLVEAAEPVGIERFVFVSVLLGDRLADPEPPAKCSRRHNWPRLSPELVPTRCQRDGPTFQYRQPPSM